MRFVLKTLKINKINEKHEMVKYRKIIHSKYLIKRVFMCWRNQ